MPRIYPKEAPKLKPGKLDDDTVYNIGRLIRACAEIEDILDFFIGNLATLNETRTGILLGKTAITRRLEIAETLAKIRPDKAHEVYKKAFPAEFGDVLECRNAVAHGALLGVAEDGEYSFMANSTSTTEGEATMRIIVSYSGPTIRNIADKAEAMVPYLEKLLQVQGRRAERLQRPLKPHPKAQDRGRAKPQRPPRSSKGKSQPR